MDQYYTIGTNEPNDASAPDDDTASTSAINEPDFIVFDPTENVPDQRPRGASGNPFNLESMETLQLRRIDMMPSSPLKSRTATIARLEGELTISKQRGISCERWAIKHDAQLSWNTDKINEGRDERAAMRTTIEELSEQGAAMKTTIEELSEQVRELTSRLDRGMVLMRSVEGVCTFRASDFWFQLQQLQERGEDRSSLTTSSASPAHPAPPAP